MRRLLASSATMLALLTAATTASAQQRTIDFESTGVTDYSSFHLYDGFTWNHLQLQPVAGTHAAEYGSDGITGMMLSHTPFTLLSADFRTISAPSQQFFIQGFTMDYLNTHLDSIDKLILFAGGTNLAFPFQNASYTQTFFAGNAGWTNELFSGWTDLGAVTFYALPGKDSEGFPLYETAVDNIVVDTTTTPEPGVAGLVGLGLVAIGGVTRLRRRPRTMVA